MEWIRILLDALFPLGGVAAFGFVAWGSWLAVRHSRFVAEGQGRFEHRHRRQARTAPRYSANQLG
jgi:hypothetical protein